MTTATKTIRILAVAFVLLANAACTQSPAGNSFDFDYHGVAEERPLYAY